MKILKLLKTLFQVFAFGIFIYQMQNSIRKYINGPIVQITSTARLHEIKNPEICVCQLNQFNSSVSKEFGYDDMLSFVTGDLMDTNYTTWRGKNGDKSFKELKKILFQHDYSDFKATYKNFKKSIIKTEEYEIVYIFPHGFCLKWRTVKSGMGIIVTSTESDLFLVDPFWSETLRLMGHHNEVIRVYKAT